MYIIFLLVCVAAGYKTVYFFGVLLVLLSFICVLCSLIKKSFFCCGVLLVIVQFLVMLCSWVENSLPVGCEVGYITVG